MEKIVNLDGCVSNPGTILGVGSSVLPNVTVDLAVMEKIHNLGEIMAVNLFGTDGIRGEFAELNGGDEVALSQLTDSRIISPQLLKLLGECLGKLGQYDVQPTVVIGWDDRPGNQKLASSLTVGLNLSIKWYILEYAQHRLCIIFH